jgi:hypothetical protein
LEERLKHANGKTKKAKKQLQEVSGNESSFIYPSIISFSRIKLLGIRPSETTKIILSRLRNVKPSLRNTKPTWKKKRKFSRVSGIVSKVVLVVETQEQSSENIYFQIRHRSFMIKLRQNRKNSNLGLLKSTPSKLRLI